MNSAKSPVLDIHVVFVDDDLHILEEMKDFLSSRVTRLETAAQGQQALDLCRDGMPDLVITDIQMPVMNGLDLTRNLRKLSDRLKIMITTAFDETSYLLEAIGAGVDFFLLKPYSLGTILEKMGQVADQKSMERSFRQQAALLEDYRLALDATAAVLKTDLEGNITYANDLYAQISGYSRQELLGKNPRIVKNPGTPPSYYKDLWETITSGQIWQGSLENRSRTGKSFFVDLTIVPLMDDRRQITEFMGIHQEVTDVLRKERLIQNLYTDPLTGLPNRMRLYDDLNESQNPNLFVVNIDSFRQVNDFFGNQIGDYIIGEMGVRLKTAVNGQGTVYRIHGDEYAVLVNKCWEDTLLEEMALKLNDAVTRTPYVHREADIRISVTIGCAYGGNSSPPRSRRRTRDLEGIDQPGQHGHAPCQIPEEGFSFI